MKLPKQVTRKQLIKELDKLCSEVVKKQAKYTCVRCKRKYAPHSKQLTCSHYWSRRNMSTRHDLANLDCLCMPCHLYQWERDKQGAYREYMLSKLGDKGYQYLEVKARTITKFTSQDLELMISLMKENL